VHSLAMHLHVSAICLALTLVVAPGFAPAAPLALLDRNGSHVSIEAYAPNIVRVTLSIDSDLAIAPPGLESSRQRMHGMETSATASGDELSSDVMSLEVKAQPWPNAPSQMERYFAPSLPPVSVTVRKPRRRPIPADARWEMRAHGKREKTFEWAQPFTRPPMSTTTDSDRTRKACWITAADHRLQTLL